MNKSTNAIHNHSYVYKRTLRYEVRGYGESGMHILECECGKEKTMDLAKYKPEYEVYE